jgi:hypothetical protein
MELYDDMVRLKLRERWALGVRERRIGAGALSAAWNEAQERVDTTITHFAEIQDSQNQAPSSAYMFNVGPCLNALALVAAEFRQRQLTKMQPMVQAMEYEYPADEGDL